MSYQFATLITHEDEDGTMFPVFSEPGDPYVFDLEPSDGADIKHLVVTALHAYDQGLQGGLKLSDVKADLYITDSRVVFCCEKFEKGGGWVGWGGGGVLLAGAANVVSKARAKHRRKGKMVAGHVRYTWLAQIGGHTKAGMLSGERLRIVVRDGSRTDNPTVLIDLTVSKSTDSIAVAQEIVRRTARYRLAHDDDVRDEHRSVWEGLAAAPRIESTKDSFGMHAMPRFWFVRPSSAHLPISS